MSLIQHFYYFRNARVAHVNGGAGDQYAYAINDNSAKPSRLTGPFKLNTTSAIVKNCDRF